METNLSEFSWDLIYIFLMAIAFIYGYFLSEDLHENQEKKLGLFTKNRFKKTDEKNVDLIKVTDNLTINKKILNSTLAVLAVYNVKADRVSQQNEIEETRISLFNFHGCGVCIWDETIANPTVFFDSTCVSVQFIAGKELRIYSPNFPFFYRITEEHNPPESLEEMALKISELARNFHN